MSTNAVEEELMALATAAVAIAPAHVDITATTSASATAPRDDLSSAASVASSSELTDSEPATPKKKKSHRDGPVNDPATYKRSQDSDWKNTSIEDIYSSWDKLIPAGELPFYEKMAAFLAQEDPQNNRELEKAFVKLRRAFKCLPKKSQMKFVLNMLVQRGDVPKGLTLEKLLVKKAQKSQSGVLVVTVLTSPYPQVGEKKQKFSCQWNCYYCPNEPGQPRSYLHDEPSVLRANRNDFDPVLQFCDRAVTLAMNGHPVDKIELLVLGGTWASYPHEYQETFIRDLFYAANTFYEREKRERKSLDEEKLENEGAAVKIIGITLETRPDCINAEELRRFRRYGCTRVQLGIQHTDDAILTKINRGCTTQDAINALRMLRDCCYKTDIHLMPNLPGSSPEKDRKMFEYVLHSEDLQADQWKIYPCEITPWTVIKKWFDKGEYVPYPDETLIELLMEVKAQVHPWIRLNRVIRDIPSQYILGGMDEPNLRQVICNRMIKAGKPCRCIRCREVKTDDLAISVAKSIVRKYRANDGDEYFISFETPDQTKICGFARLRITKDPGAGVFPELVGAALVRELHVYGQLVAAGEKNKKVGLEVGEDETSQAQHIGFGTQLMMKAEEIARANGYKKVAVIAGVGVRNFYRRLGFEVEGEGELMIKHLSDDNANESGVVAKARAFVQKQPNVAVVVAAAAAVVVVGVLGALVHRR